MENEESISVGKPVKGKKNKEAHNPTVGLNLSSKEIMAVWDKRQKEKEAQQ